MKKCYVLRNTLFALALIAALTYCTSSAQAQGSDAVGTTSANFLKIGVGARAGALGGAFVAIADDATAGYWNPAGLSRLGHTELAFMHNSWYEGVNYEYLGIGLSATDNVGLGLGISYLDYGTFDGYSENNVRTGDYSAGSMLLSASASVAVSENLSIGATGKMISEQLDQTTGRGFAADLGVLYRLDAWSFGVNYMNIGSGVDYGDQSYPLPERLLAGASVTTFDGRFRIATDFEKPSDFSSSVHQGLEYTYNNTFSLRGGYVHSLGSSSQLESDGITLGFGLRYSLGRMDYSYTPGSELGDVHKFSVSIAFGSHR